MIAAVHFIPPGYFCVPSALIALTGEDPASVLIPAINRHDAAEELLEAPAGVSTRVAEAVLRELGYSVRRYRGGAAGPLRALVRTWAGRSLRWPGRPLLITTEGAPSLHRPGHALVVCDGRVYDNHAAHGPMGPDHPYATAMVDYAALVGRRTP